MDLFNEIRKAFDYKNNERVDSPEEKMGNWLKAAIAAGALYVVTLLLLNALGVDFGGVPILIFIGGDFFLIKSKA